jgi:alpha-galactosidase
MEKMQLKLYPKEEIRTPKICLLFWKGDNRMIGHNQFRQFILTHHSRKINGQFAEYPLTAGLRFGDDYPCTEFECTTEEYLLGIVKRYKQFNIVPEAFWLDAGWYEGCGWDKERGSWWYNVGNWIPAKERFPNGLRPVSEAIHEAGAKFLVWFEPERVRPQTIIDREHPEWLLKLQGRDDYLFNLGNNEARIWLTDYITTILKKEGIDYYRQDFNMDPYPYWMANDQPGRIGISEIRHIEGLYAFWDSLLVRFPHILIDNCASGGRRLDLETTSRSAPLWRTDYNYGEPNGMQCHTYSLNFYLPIHSTSTSIVNEFDFRSGLNAAATGNWLVGRGLETIAVSRKYMQEFKALRPYFYSDYYPLTSTWNYTSNSVWLAYQLNRPQQKDGIIVAFRREDNRQTSIRIKPSGLEKDAVYELYYEDYGIRSRQTGSELMNGFDITIPFQPASLLIKYCIVPGQSPK